MSEALVWVKSPHSATGNCVEVANHDRRVMVRDTNDRTGPVLRFTPAAWRRFADQVKRSLASEFGGACQTPNRQPAPAVMMVGPGTTDTGHPASLAFVPRDAAIAANWSNAACKSSTISAAISSGAGRLPVSSSDSSRSQKMSSEALSLATSSS